MSKYKILTSHRLWHVSPLLEFHQTTLKLKGTTTQEKWALFSFYFIFFSITCNLLILQLKTYWTNLDAEQQQYNPKSTLMKEKFTLLYFTQKERATRSCIKL